jgi:hypothetical protein
MLLLAGILLSVIAVGVFLLTAFAEGMSDRQVSKGEFWGAQWPAILALLLAIACFVARHFLHGHTITW